LDVETFSEMRDAVFFACTSADVLIMAAAVSDFHVVDPANNKIKKKGEKIVIELGENPDFLLELADNIVKIGFAAETEALVANARKKLVSKRLNFICANDVTDPEAGFAVDTNRVTILYATGEQEALPLMTKRALADEIIDRALRFL
jgi:phosphopantothenoylcysteine decarboxylase/phosphopantothenate--cysteine ligase